ncbi:MAG TPA: hypothetical protein VHN82_08940 [Methanoregula sp.]|nr:hypothetical protein [Methanoregula sp.]
MIKFTWEAKLAIFLVAASICIYTFKLTVLKNPSDTADDLFNALGFLPINVLLVTIVLDKLLTMRSRQERMEKMNMVIGTFFSEVGNDLISRIARTDPAIDGIKRSLIVGNDWDARAFAGVRKTIAGHEYRIDIAAMDIPGLREFLLSRRDFMLRLLENPVLLEHESFTDLLRAVFHLTEELRCRGDLTCLPGTDYAHLAGDTKRVYEKLILQWLDYMEYLKNNYPYLYSLEMRTNPFDARASPVVQ